MYNSSEKVVRLINFLTSQWFMWVAIVVIVLGIISIVVRSASEQSVEWGVIWHVTKKIFGYFLAMIFLPFVIIFGRTKAKERSKHKEGAS